MTRTVCKWTVPVDDSPHEIGGGQVIHVACQYGRPDEVQVWTVEEAVPTPKRRAMVFGTGETIPDNIGSPLGTALVPSGRLVWHVFEVAW